MTGKGKSIDGLMRHIRDEHSIHIGGSKNKRSLTNMGYFHGYKAYRFKGNNRTLLPINDFSQIEAIHKLDNDLKNLLYPVLMRYETSFKNNLIDVLVSNNQTLTDDIIVHKLNEYKEHAGDARNKILQHNLDFRKMMYQALSGAYGNNRAVTHYYDQDKPLPIWVVFEVLTLGQIATFASLLNTNTKISFAINLGIYDEINDPKAKLLVEHIYIINSLRNSVAHNNIIFDGRFKTRSIERKVIKDLSHKFNIAQQEVNFNTVTDYFALLIMYDKAFKTNKTTLNHLVLEYSKIIEEFRDKIGAEIFSSIFGTNTKAKIKAISEYI